MAVPMVDYLKANYREPQPAWLDLARPDGGAAARRAILDGFLRSRIVYYPGCGNDGQPVKLFNRAHAAHAYVYVDYGISRETLHRNFTPDGIHPEYGFRGYQTIACFEFERHELLAGSDDGPLRIPGWDILEGPWGVIPFKPYAVLYVMERLPGFDENHGAQRFGVLAILADGFAAYVALFCQQGSVAKPFCVTYEEAGLFGGNWNRFGGEGVFPGSCLDAGVWPELLQAAENSLPWPGYERVPDVIPEIGGWYYRERYLYRRKPALDPWRVHREWFRMRMPLVR